MYVTLQLYDQTSKASLLLELAAVTNYTADTKSQDTQYTSLIYLP